MAKLCWQVCDAIKHVLHPTAEPISELHGAQCDWHCCPSIPTVQIARNLLTSLPQSLQQYHSTSLYAQLEIKHHCDESSKPQWFEPEQTCCVDFSHGWKRHVMGLVTSMFCMAVQLFGNTGKCHWRRAAYEQKIQWDVFYLVSISCIYSEPISVSSS